MVHPVFDRAFDDFDVGDLGGYKRGRPRLGLTRTGSVGDIGGSSAMDSALTSERDSSCSSIFNTTSSRPLPASSRVSERLSAREDTPESKAGVFIGDSLLDDMEGCGDELTLRRACAPGGGCPREKVDGILPGTRATVVAICTRWNALDAEDCARK